MPLLRLIAEGIGPFERLGVDLSDGKGNPHLGPHIFAGVNGSGKSTVLRTLAWVMDDLKRAEFPMEEWAHFTVGHAHSRAYAVIRPAGGRAYVSARAMRDDRGTLEWMRSTWAATALDLRLLGSIHGADAGGDWQDVDSYHFLDRDVTGFDAGSHSDYGAGTEGGVSAWCGI
jgi:hypothetical protein